MEILTNKFLRSIDMGDFRLDKLEPTVENAERLLSVINANREFLGEFLEWVDGYTTTDKTLANIEKSYGDDKLPARLALLIQTTIWAKSVIGWRMALTVVA